MNMLRLAARPLMTLLMWGWIGALTAAGQASMAQNRAPVTNAAMVSWAKSKVPPN